MHVSSTHLGTRSWVNWNRDCTERRSMLTVSMMSPISTCILSSASSNKLQIIRHMANSYCQWVARDTFFGRMLSNILRSCGKEAAPRKTGRDSPRPA